ncbi:hypothetical protein, partial [Paenibacillus arenilitoris]|uniref:hypothetical protein n=1 Tax=Paenibacillus arenilitoris TaxID=2772299 RepID=UPI001CC2242C
SIGKPYAGKPHVRFDEEGLVTPALYSTSSFLLYALILIIIINQDVSIIMDAGCFVNEGTGRMEGTKAGHSNGGFVEGRRAYAHREVKTGKD